MNIVIVDSSPIMRVGLALACAEAKHSVVASMSDLDDTCGRVDLVICDIMTPSRSGLALIDDVRATTAGGKVLFFSMVTDVSIIALLLAAGADGYVTKSQSCAELAEALAVVARGGRYLPPTVSQAELAAAERDRAFERFAGLSKREREVFELTVRGLSHDQVAKQLSISRRTAETHRHRIVHKLGAASMSDAVRLGALHSAIGSRGPA